jgi:hypothetical protein
VDGHEVSLGDHSMNLDVEGPTGPKKLLAARRRETLHPSNAARVTRLLWSSGWL